MEIKINFRVWVGVNDTCKLKNDLLDTKETENVVQWMLKVSGCRFRGKN